ncbi:DoxX family membrane protein [Plantactinospora sonchi]|uniref:DoxX family membrane protein n=1 Tax=Plantactinospora sonchi TaxID=1544735 RepID=A0ABU7RTP3_9ACTN
MNLSHLPLRVTIGAYVLNSGLSKLNLEGEAAVSVHGMAVGAIPPVKRVPPETFARLLAGTEIALGAALLLPVIPSALVGAGLVGFGGGLVRLYWATPGMHGPGDPRPTQHGTGLAKDSWLVGAGLTLLLDDLFGRAAGKRRALGRRLGGRPRRG